MVRDRKPQGAAVIRHPDGSINFDAYRAAARRARRAAMASSIESAVHAVGAVLSSIAAGLAGKSARQPAHHVE